MSNNNRNTSKKSMRKSNVIAFVLFFVFFFVFPVIGVVMSIDALFLFQFMIFVSIIYFWFLIFNNVPIFQKLITILWKKSKPITGFVIFVFVGIVAGISLKADISSRSTPIKNVSYDTTYQDTEAITVETSVEKIEAINMRGRGESDNGRNEPDYIGETGYVAVGFNEEKMIQENDDFGGTPWYIPIYEKNDDGFIEIGTVEHKTKVYVNSQSLYHTGWGWYDGYLEVTDDIGNQFYIDVNNFLTYPYWDDSDLEKSALYGMFIAEYQNISGNSPMSGERAVTIENGKKVLVVGLASNSKNEIEAVVFGEWRYGYGGVRISFDKEDLKIVY